MSAELQTTYAAGQTLYAVILGAQGLAFNGTAHENIAEGNWPNYAVPLSEQGTASGIYLGDLPAAIAAAGIYTAIVYRQAGASPAVGDVAIAQGEVRWSGSEEIGPGDNYWAELRFTQTPAQDKYLVQWFRGGRPISTGITAATIHVTRSSGSALISGQAMGLVGAMGALRYETSSQHLAAGENALVEVTATIDGAVRTFRQTIGSNG